MDKFLTALHEATSHTKWQAIIEAFDVWAHARKNPAPWGPEEKFDAPEEAYDWARQLFQDVKDSAVRAATEFSGRRPRELDDALKEAAACTVETLYAEALWASIMKVEARDGE